MQTIHVVPEMPDWMTSAEAAKHLGKNVRTVQEYAKEGRITTKPAGNKRQPQQRLYSGADISRLIGNPSPENRGGARTPATASNKPKPGQEERALDTVAIVGNQAIGYKGAIEALALQSTRQIELLVAQMDRQLAQSEHRFEAFVTLMLQHQKAEADANRERLKAEREDARERWEIERQDKLARQKARLAKPPEKAKRAHA